MVAANRMIRMRRLGKLGIAPSEAEADLHAKLFEYGPSGPSMLAFDLDAVERWLIRMRDANRVSSYVPDSALRIVLYEFWRRCCKGGRGHRLFGRPRCLHSLLIAETPLGTRLRSVVKMVLCLPHFPWPLI